MKKLFWMFTLAVLILGTSCNKKDKTPSRTDLITAGTWKITSAVSDNDANGSFETDDYASFPSCFIDNYYTFKTDGNMEMNEGATKCSPSDPQTDQTTWHFSQNDTHLTIDTDDYSVEELTANSIRLKEDLGSGRSSMVTLTKR